MTVPGPHLLAPLQQVIPRGTRVEVFNTIFWVFLGLGTLVGVVVIGYMLYNAYKYRDGAGHGPDPEDRPELGELPSGGGKGRKLFLSFALSAVIVVSLIVWTYGTLLYVEGAAAQQQQAAPADEKPLNVTVEGYRFGWTFYYPNGYNSTTLVIPEDRMVRLTVTSRDVWHNFGVPALRVKSDAIPGEVTTTWMEASETGTYTAKCYELCGTGHSYMVADVEVVRQEEFQAWYDNTTAYPNGDSPLPGEQAASGGSGGESESGDHGDGESGSGDHERLAPPVGAAPSWVGVGVGVGIGTGTAP